MKRFSKVFGNITRARSAKVPLVNLNRDCRGQAKVSLLLIAFAAIIVGITACGNLFGDKDDDSKSDDDESKSANEYNSAGNFTINNFAQLELFAKIVAGTTGPNGPAQSDFTGRTVTLNADIDMSDQEWEGVGYNNVKSIPFNGTFDGNNKTISGLQKGQYGFFVSIGERGIVKNLNFVGVDVQSSALTGTNNGKIQNVSIKGRIDYRSTPGGVVGSNYGIVENCNFSGDISGGYAAGGIVAYNDTAGIVRNCFVTGSIATWAEQGTGGIVGQNLGTVEKCYTTCNVTGSNGVTGGNVGGIVGQNWPSGIIKNCYATGDVFGGGNTGGVVGASTYSGNYASSGMVQNCYATGNVTGTSRVGGITGGIGRVQNCVALNPSITATKNDYSGYGYGGRVSGTSDNSNNCSNNYALKDMQVSTTANVTVEPDENGIHGADVEAVEYNTQTWWVIEIDGWDFDTVWQWDSASNLPKLR